MRKPRSSKMLSRRTLLATLLVGLDRQQKELLCTFLNRQIIVKCVDGVRIEGKLNHVDRSEHDHCLGNLLVDNSLVRGNMVCAIIIEER